MSWLKIWSQSLPPCLMGVGTAERLERSVSIFGGTRWRLTEPSVCHHSSQGRWAGLSRAIPGMSIILLLAAAATSAMCNASLTLKLDRRMICLALLDFDHDISVWEAVIMWALTDGFSATVVLELEKSNYLLILELKQVFTA